MLDVSNKSPIDVIFEFNIVSRLLTFMLMFVNIIFDSLCCRLPFKRRLIRIGKVIVFF